MDTPVTVPVCEHHSTAPECALDLGFAVDGYARRREAHAAQQVVQGLESYSRTGTAQPNTAGPWSTRDTVKNFMKPSLTSASPRAIAPVSESRESPSSEPFGWITNRGYVSHKSDMT